MSMTAKERATMLLKAVTADECGDADCPEHAGLHALFKLTLRAHANAALERAVNVAESKKVEGLMSSDPWNQAADKIAAAIRNLCKEE